MRLPRFRARTLMIAVGVVALLIWGAMMGTRSYVYYRLARAYGTYERQKECAKSECNWLHRLLLP